MGRGVYIIVPAQQVYHFTVDAHFPLDGVAARGFDNHAKHSAKRVRVRCLAFIKKVAQQAASIEGDQLAIARQFRDIETFCSQANFYCFSMLLRRH